MSIWHDELEFELLRLEDARVDSDYMTFVISSVLNKYGIFHQCRLGYAEDLQSGTMTLPHCWIELEQGWFIDLALRRWLDDENDIPHGVFQPSKYPRVRYRGLPLQAPGLDEDELTSFTDGRHKEVRISQPLTHAAHVLRYKRREAI